MATKTIKASGGDFTTLTAWLNSLPATLTEPEIAELDAFDLVDQILISKATSAANYIEIRPAAGVQTTGVFGITKARLRNGSGGTNSPIRIGGSAAHVRIHGFQIYQETASGSAGAGPIGFTTILAGSDIRIYDVLLRDAQSTGSTYTFNASVANLNLTLYNAVMYGAVRSIDTRNATSAKIDNVIFWRTASQLGVVSSSEATIRNCYSGSSVAGADCFWTTGTPTGSYNASSDTSALTKFPTGSINNVAGSAAFMSVTPGSEDFRHASGTSPLVNVGLTIAAVTTDISGKARPQGASYDIGAFEYSASATPVTQDFIATFIVQTSANRDLVASYTIGDTVQRDFVAGYTIGDTVVRDLAASYAVRTSAQRDLGATYTIQSGGATFTSEPLTANTGELRASQALNFVRLYNDTTGLLVVEKTGISTNSAGVFSVTDSSLNPGTFYRADWEFADGVRGMPRKAAA